MQWGTVRSRLLTTARAVKPCVRVIALVYTGLGAMLAMALVVAVALVPMGPALQQVAEPARQAVSNFVQPTTEAVATFFGGGAVVQSEPVAMASEQTRPSAFSEFVSLEVTIGDSLLPLDEPVAVVAAAPRVPVAEARTPAPETDDEIVGLESIEVSAPDADAPVVAQPVPSAGLQIASHDAPKPLPTLPAPTETPLQVKTRLDVANQAAIDAAKATQARAKAEADAANNAAIAARKAAATALPTSASPTAKNAKPSAKATPTPTAQPTPPPAQPTAKPSPTASVAGVTVENEVPAIGADTDEQQIDEASLENVPVDQA